MTKPYLERWPEPAPWWPDFTGKTVLIAASGASQRKTDIGLAFGRAKVVVVNRTWELAPWADVFYSGDRRFFEQHGDPEFKGLKVTGDEYRSGYKFADAKKWLPASTWLHNSGAQALVYAVAWGARRVALTGFDMAPGHWHAENPNWNPKESTFAKFISGLSALAPDLAERGVEVFNCSRRSALTCFPTAALRDVFE